MSRVTCRPLPYELWSLRDMLEIQALPFLSAVTEMSTLIVRIDNVPNKAAPVEDEVRSGILLNHATKLVAELQKLGARSAIASADRLKRRLEDDASGITYETASGFLLDIQSRFADHLADIKLFVLAPGEVGLFGSVDDVLSVDENPVKGFSMAYPKAAFEIEESAKCIALGRFTASAFHSIRALECGIKAIARYLGIPDPTKPAEKNWALILKAIESALDTKWPKPTRTAGSEGAKLEALYATLDTVKNPWRNATMHVETTYAPHEALHILRCVSMFMLELARRCDEEGRPPGSSPASPPLPSSP